MSYLPDIFGFNFFISSQEVLDDLDLPIAVKAGILGRFSLSIPWKALKSKVSFSSRGAFLSRATYSLCSPQ
jgi:hypothetical protein